MRSKIIMASLVLALTPFHISANTLRASQAASGAPALSSTEWTVRPAVGMDAILLLGAASGDIMQADIYAETIAFVRERISPEGLAALDELDQVWRQNGQLTGPTLAYIFSFGPIDSIDDVIASAADPDRWLRRGLESSAQWDSQRYDELVTRMPAVHTALNALKEVGFEEWYARANLPNVMASIERIEEAVSPYDVIAEQERLLGRELDDRIEILVVRFALPYGIRISGQRFLAFYDLEGDIQLRIAAHELFHPPFDLDDPVLAARFSAWETDPWLRSIVEDHDPRFGYNSFLGVVNEDSTQALDQIVSHRLGFAHDPAARWQSADGGMHMLAAALYQAMVEDGFAQDGGTYSEWLRSALERGLLTPDELRRRAALIVGEQAVNAWGAQREMPAE